MSKTQLESERIKSPIRLARLPNGTWPRSTPLKMVAKPKAVSVEAKPSEPVRHTDPGHGSLEIVQIYDLVGKVRNLSYSWLGDGPKCSISQPFVAAVRPEIARGDWIIGEKVWLGPCSFKLLASWGLVFYARRMTPLWLLNLRQRRWVMWLWNHGIRL